MRRGVERGCARHVRRGHRGAAVGRITRVMLPLEAPAPSTRYRSPERQIHAGGPIVREGGLGAATGDSGDRDDVGVGVARRILRL